MTLLDRLRLADQLALSVIDAQVAEDFDRAGVLDPLRDDFLAERLSEAGQNPHEEIIGEAVRQITDESMSILITCTGRCRR